MHANEARDTTNIVRNNELAPIFDTIKLAALKGNYSVATKVSDRQIVSLRRLGYSVQLNPYDNISLISWT